jgi:hypothetical protein
MIWLPLRERERNGSIASINIPVEIFLAFYRLSANRTVDLFKEDAVNSFG